MWTGYLTDLSQCRILFTTLTLSLCWSTDMVSQALELSNQPHVVVATPGRLADHIRSSSTFSLSKIQFLVRNTDCFLTALSHMLSLEITTCLCIQTITFLSFYFFDIRGPCFLICRYAHELVILCGPLCQIMDEADRLLEQGCTDFTKDLETIMPVLPAKRQTLLFSATLTDTLQELKNIAMSKPFFWESKSE